MKHCTWGKFVCQKESNLTHTSPIATNMTHEHRPTPSQRLIPPLLALVLLVGAGLRLYNLRWDLGTFPHPDERSTLLFYAPTIRFPKDPADWLDPRKSPLNPFWDTQTGRRRSYTYGHFPLYLLVATGDLLHRLATPARALNLSPATVAFFRQANTGLGYAVVGRALVALFDTLSIYLVFLIARRLYGPWAGLLAAAFSAFAVLHIQLAHFFAVDPISTTFVLLTLYASIRMLDEPATGWATLAGVGVGLAVSSKFSALPVALAPATAAWFLWRRPVAGESAPPADRFNRAFHLLAMAAIVSFLTFAVTSPFVLLDFDNFRQAVLKEQGDMVSGVADLPFTRQYRNTPAYLYFIEQQV
ncbi:MAG: phospholipid carrier-dependent glycosyltransferase, partial [Caldilineae bacterium]